MAEDDWQLEAVHEQFDVFNKLTTRYENIPSSDTVTVMVKVRDISRKYLKNCIPHQKLQEISREIVKYPDGNEIKLSFVVIVTNIEIGNGLSKMPVFVVTTSGTSKFIDMSLTCFNSWETFLKYNSFPSCQYCFPVGGQYIVGGELMVDFAPSPNAIRKNVHIIWKSLGFVVAVGMVAASYFFKIPPVNHSQTDSLLKIAEDFTPSIRKYGRLILTGITLVMRLREGQLTPSEAVRDICRLLQRVNQEFNEEITWIYGKVKEVLWSLYNRIRRILADWFEVASEWARHMFVATTSRIDSEINAVDSEAEELLEASRRSNQQGQNRIDAARIHDEVNIGNDSGYARTIFRNARNESALQNGISKNIHPITSELLTVSTSIAEKLGKKNLKDVQDIFEALSDITNQEFKNKIETYTKMQKAAQAGAGHPIDLDAFNKSLGIEGDPKEHFWREAILSSMRSRLAVEKIKEKIEILKENKRILIVELQKKVEDDIAGLYRCVGVYGSGKFSASDLIKALEDIQVHLDEETLVINETEELILIRSEDLTIATQQVLNSDGTSESMLWIERMEV